MKRFCWHSLMFIAMMVMIRVIASAWTGGVLTPLLETWGMSTYMLAGILGHLGGSAVDYIIFLRQRRNALYDASMYGQ